MPLLEVPLLEVPLKQQHHAQMRKTQTIGRDILLMESSLVCAHVASIILAVVHTSTMVDTCFPPSAVASSSFIEAVSCFLSSTRP